MSPAPRYRKPLAWMAAVLATMALLTLAGAFAIYTALDMGPRPIVATAAELRTLLPVVLADLQGRALPPSAGDAPTGRWVISDHAIVLVEARVCCGGPQENWEIATVAGWETIESPDWRAEMVAANRRPRRLPLAGIPGLLPQSESAIAAAFADDWWDSFYQRYPDSVGLLRITMPVLTPDRRQAMLYVTRVCDGLCGSGTVYRLERSEQGWGIIERKSTWVS